MKSIRTRDPKPKNRDPEPIHESVQGSYIPPKNELPPPSPPEPKRKTMVCVPEIAAQCPKCKSTVSKIDATREEQARGIIIKYRTCKACGNKFASRFNQQPVEQWPAVEGVDG